MKLFESDRHNAAFERDGFLTVPLLPPESVDALRRLYRSTIRPDEVTDLYESSRWNAYETNREINEAIRAELEEPARRLFGRARLFGGSFMVKSHRSSDQLPLHQDWSVVEPDHATAFIWCPLLDVTPRNGCLFAVPGSHRYFEGLRSGSYPSDRFVLPGQLQRSVRDLPLTAGEAVIYSDDLFHGSHGNDGEEDRLVVTGRVIDPEGRLVYFHARDEETVDVYEADEAFYLTRIDELAKGQEPSGARKLYSRPYSHQPVTDQALRDAIRTHGGISDLDPAAGETAECRIFRDPELQESFERDGYVVIDLLDPQQVAELVEYHASIENAPVPEYGFQVSLDNKSPEFVRDVADTLLRVAGGEVERHFEDFKLFTASFVIKEGNPMGVVPPHQDWTFVDESRYWSATIWCPLVDVDQHNGGLGVIKGSHRLYDHVRPSPSPQYAPPFKDQLFQIFPFVQMIELRAGQALVFDNRTLHASPPNTTEQTRLAFGLGITHQEASIHHYFLLPDVIRDGLPGAGSGSGDPWIEGYEVDADFFCRYNNARLSAMHDAGERPDDCPRLGYFAHQHREIEDDALVERIRAAGNAENHELMETLAELFGYNLDGTRKAEPGGEESEPTADEISPPLWRVYTPLNILREIRYRIGKRLS